MKIEMGFFPLDSKYRIFCHKYEENMTVIVYWILQIENFPCHSVWLIFHLSSN
jgi:hypothetical protein